MSEVNMEIDEKVLITWHDARFYPGTYKKEDILNHKMALFESMGYLISKDAQTTVIAAERNDEGEYRDVTLMPTGSIVSTGRLSLVEVEDVPSKNVLRHDRSWEGENG